MHTYIHAYMYTCIHTYIHIMWLCASRSFLLLQMQEMGAFPQWTVLPTSRRHQSIRYGHSETICKLITVKH